MNISKESRRIIKNIERYTGIPEANVRKVFKVLLNEIACDYHDNKEHTIIPCIGKISLEYNGDIVEKENGIATKKAKLDINFSPDEWLSKTVGQLEDGVVTDIEKFIISDISNVLESHMN